MTEGGHSGRMSCKIKRIFTRARIAVGRAKEKELKEKELS